MTFRDACTSGHRYIAGSPTSTSFQTWLADHASCEAITGHRGDETVRPTQAHPDGTVGGSASLGRALSGTSVHSGMTHTTARGDK